MSEIVTKGGEKLYKAETEKEIDELYRHHDVLAEAGEEASKHNESYKYILDAVRTGQERVKQLACQFIPKFFKYFDKLDSQAINAMLDLCEEESRNVWIGVVILDFFLCFYPKSSFFFSHVISHTYIYPHTHTCKHTINTDSIDCHQGTPTPVQQQVH